MFVSHLVLFECQMWKLKYTDSNDLYQTLCIGCFQTSIWVRLKDILSSITSMIRKYPICDS